MQPVYRHTESFTGKYSENGSAYNPNPIKTIIQSPPRPVTGPLIIKNKPPKNLMNILQPPLPRLSQGSTTSTNSTTSSPTQSNSLRQTLSNSGSKQQPVDISDILPALRELQIRVVSLSEAVIHHEQILNTITSQKPPISSPESDTVKNITQLVNDQLQKRSRQDKQFKLKLNQTQLFNKNRLMNEILNVRQQLTKEFKERVHYDQQYFSEIARKETEVQITSMYEVNREVFRRIEIDMNQLRELIEVSKSSGRKEEKLPLLSSNRRYSDPIMIRYREVVDRVKLQPSLMFNNLGLGEQYVPVTQQPALLNEVIYYLDRQYNLLDNDFNYLVDQNGENIKLQEKCIHLLQSSNILEAGQRL